MEAARPLDTMSRTVGADLRALRKARSLTLTELAVRLGRSVGWLSQVERGLSEPSISDLRNLADVFGVSVSFFFSADEAVEDQGTYVVRAGSRRSLGDPAAGLVEELLSPDLGGAFEMLRSRFAPGAEMTRFQTRPTEEAGYIVAGRLDLWIGEECFHLGPGDSFRFRGEPYRWRNPGKVEAVAIWTIAPPVY